MLDIQPTTARLYKAADEMRDIRGQSAVARLLNVSPQVMKNWEARGVSEGGALLAQKIIGCDANWVLNGTGQMYVGTEYPQALESHHGASEPAAIYKLPGKWPFQSFSPSDWDSMDPDSKAQIETYARGLVDRALLAKRKAI